MDDRYDVQFFTLARGDQVGEILEDPFGNLPVILASKAEFETWAQRALLDRLNYCKQRGLRAPDAVRACAADGTERFRWSYWDQQAHQAREYQKEQDERRKRERGEGQDA
jgi:hypothetical protein